MPEKGIVTNEREAIKSTGSDFFDILIEIYRDHDCELKLTPTKTGRDYGAEYTDTYRKITGEWIEELERKYRQTGIGILGRGFRLISAIAASISGHDFPGYKNIECITLFDRISLFNVEHEIVSVFRILGRPKREFYVGASCEPILFGQRRIEYGDPRDILHRMAENSCMGQYHIYP